jgi:hypothetical protein
MVVTAGLGNRVATKKITSERVGAFVRNRPKVTRLDKGAQEPFYSQKDPEDIASLGRIDVWLAMVNIGQSFGWRETSQY